MNNKVTKHSLPYPKGFEPNYIDPCKYERYRFALGKSGKNPLVVICMNPSAANESSSDMTINRVISVSQKLKMDGWVVFNVYPERATNARDIGRFNSDLSNRNTEIICDFLKKNRISEVWGAWGNDNNIEALVKGKRALLSKLHENNIKIFYFGTLTKDNNPRHPIQRIEKWDYASKQYISEFNISLK